MPNNRPYLTEFRVRPYANSWNISGWCVMAFFPISKVWVRTSRFYLTKWGATRELQRREDDVALLNGFRHDR